MKSVHTGVFAAATIGSSTARLGDTVAACGITVEVSSTCSASPAGEPFPGEIGESLPVLTQDNMSDKVLFLIISVFLLDLEPLYPEYGLKPRPRGCGRCGEVTRKLFCQVNE
jgi:hypothetical protein